MSKVRMKGGKEGEKGKKIKFKKKVPKKVKTQENIEQLKSQYGEINSRTVKSFNDLPLSKETLAGLKAGELKLVQPIPDLDNFQEVTLPQPRSRGKQ